MSEIDDAVARAFAEYEREQMTHTASPPKADAGPRERGRMVAQGLTFGGADEAEAWLRSTIGGEDYDTALQDVRQKLDAYRGARPWEALAYEAGGATLPAIAATFASGGTAAPAAGARVLPMLGRLAGIGAAEGGAYAFLTGEGGPQERLERVPFGAVMGAAGAEAGYGAAKLGSAAAGRFLDYAKRSLGGRAGRRVERELTRVMADNDLTLDDVLRRIDDGEILAEMTPPMRDVVRGYRAQSRGASSVLARTYEPVGAPGRPDTLRQETMDYLQQHLGGDADDNVMRQVRRDIGEQKAAESAEYERIFATAAPLGEDIIEDLRGALSRVPEAGGDIKKLYRARTGRSPFFDIDAEGNVTFDRPPTLEDAEIIRRGIDTAASRQFRAGAGTVGTEYLGVERGVRGTLDEASGELRATRARWSAIENAREAFESGQKALARSPDEIEIEWEGVQSAGDRAVMAYRQGILHALRRKRATGSAKSLPRNIANEERREGAIMRIVFPEDELPGLLSRAERATASQEAANRIMGGADTEITKGRRQEMNLSAISGAIDAMTGGTGEMMRLAGQALKSLQPSLSPKEVTRLAELMVTTRPEVLRRAMTDTTVAGQVMNLGQAILARAGPPGGAGGAVAGASLGLNLMDETTR